MTNTDMNRGAREMFEDLVSKDPHQLNSSQRAFLKARRDYMSEEELKKFAEVLELEVEEVSLMDLKRADLDEMAEGLGLEPSEFKNKKQIVKAIEEAQAEDQGSEE